jgi:hypothetical protein
MTSPVWTVVIAVLAFWVFNLQFHNRVLDLALEAKKQEYHRRLLRMDKAMDSVKKTLNERDNEVRKLWKALGRECRSGQHLERMLKSRERTLALVSDENQRLRSLSAKSAKSWWRMFRRSFTEPHDEFDLIVQHQKAVKDGQYTSVDELNERKRLMRNLERAWHFERSGGDGLFSRGWRKYFQIEREIREKARENN